jgi:hypothetical protein
MGEAALDAVRAGMRGLRAPGAYDAVHKDECAFSFHTPFSTAAGLLLNLHTLRSVSDEFLAADHQRTGHSLYLRMQYTKVRESRCAWTQLSGSGSNSDIDRNSGSNSETLTRAWPRAAR